MRRDETDRDMVPRENAAPGEKQPKEREDPDRNATYTQIAESLAAHYDLIYYIDCETSGYKELSPRKKSGELKIRREGTDFFAESAQNIDRMIHPEDRERLHSFLDRDYLISGLENRRRLTQDYRMYSGNGKTQYTRMTVTYASDRSHFIICVENRDQDVRREQEQLAALSAANTMARRDELTHTKNKTAYHETEKELQKEMDEGCDPFAIVICDINGLKTVNDTEGHRAGDAYIQAACSLICRTFQHSPVFRVGGDEFVAVLRGDDYRNREKLLAGMGKRVEEHIQAGSGPVVAAGLAEYRPGEDHLVEDVFNRADALMYENKNHLREQELIRGSQIFKGKSITRMIPEERRLMLDRLYRAFEIVSEGTYVYLCDMKYDFSRWSKAAVDLYGLPAEYMYNAGDIWEERIHPDDREVYHKGINDIFSGNAAGHDMQYRAQRTTGEYDVCTCRGTVIRDAAGDPDYFAGTIRNHGIQSHIDTLTGLRNQYGFFEDLEGHIKRHNEVIVALYGIRKFSEINEIYGYNFGNRVLQQFARSIYDGVSNNGHIYRIDGTRFAVISGSITLPELKRRYTEARAYFHEQFQVDGKEMLLDLNGGAVLMDAFDVDSQTAYSCLNFAYTESKDRRKGDLVVFRNALKGQSQQSLEMLHDIRNSVTHGYEGFYLLYQPVVDAQTEKMIGAEALLRWKDERWGVVPPDQFIPVLETDPLFPELGEWILREAVGSARQILARDPDFMINVNLSYSQLERPDFADRVLQILDELGYPPEHICLEITERCRLLDMGLLKNMITALKARGVRVALDDFGTGFSSVGILREIPFDTIKIDRGYVREIEQNETDRQLVRTMIDQASIFNVKVCVEGIETAKMRDILRKLQAQSFQGYYYAKPLPFEQLCDRFL